MNAGTCLDGKKLGASDCRYNVVPGTAGFNTWGWKAGCAFAQASCESLEAAANDNTYTCNRNAPNAQKTCTANNLALGRCMLDQQGTYDECPRVVEYSNGGCAAPEATVPGPNDAIDGWFRGPSSRCIDQSARFGRNGYSYSSGKPSAECYRMECVRGELQVVIDGVRIPCPQGTYVRLDEDYPGACLPCPHPSVWSSSAKVSLRLRCRRRLAVSALQRCLRDASHLSCAITSSQPGYIDPHGIQANS